MEGKMNTFWSPGARGFSARTWPSSSPARVTKSWRWSARLSNRQVSRDAARADVRVRRGRGSRSGRQGGRGRAGHHPLRRSRESALPEEFRPVNVAGPRTSWRRPRTRTESASLRVHLEPSGLGHRSTEPGRLGRRAPPVTHYGRSKLRAERAVLAAEGTAAGHGDSAAHDLRPSGYRNVRVLSDGLAAGPALPRRWHEYPAASSTAETRPARPSGPFSPTCPAASATSSRTGESMLARDAGRARAGARSSRAAPVRAPFFVLQGAATVSEGVSKLRKKAVMLTRDKLNELRRAPLGVRRKEHASRARLDAGVRLGHGSKASGGLVPGQWVALTTTAWGTWAGRFDDDRFGGHGPAPAGCGTRSLGVTAVVGGVDLRFRRSLRQSSPASAGPCPPKLSSSNAWEGGASEKHNGTEATHAERSDTRNCAAAPVDPPRAGSSADHCGQSRARRP